MKLEAGSNFEAQDVKRVAIYNLLRGYWQLAEKLDKAMLSSYLDAVEDCSAESVVRACKRISSGQAGLNSSFPATPADIAERAAAIDETVRERVPQYNGLIEMDWGHGRVDLRGLTNDEQDQIIRGHGMIGDKNAALLSLEAKRDALRVAKRLAPPAPVKVPLPELKPWEDPNGWVEWSPDWGDFPPISRDAPVWIKVAGAGWQGIPPTGPRLYGEQPTQALNIAWTSRNGDIRVIAYKVARNV